MKCANHPAADATAYCQHCGKPLCAECIRTHGEKVLCESCASPAGEAATASAGAPSLPNPALAAVLGFIPGVGAMYNGQLAKALAHVILFAIFVALSHISVIFALMVPAWIFYQVFEAYQTAKARVEGKPVPDHLGLNQIGSQWFGGSPVPPSGRQAPPEAQPDLQAVAPPPETALYEPTRTTGVKEPAWAVALIIFGLLLLLKTLGIPETNWIGRSWPVLFAVFGAYLLTRSFVRALRAAPAGWTRLAHNAWGPSFLILLGILWSLDRWRLLGLHKSWPLFLILAGLLILFERVAASWSERRADPAAEQESEAV